MMRMNLRGSRALLLAITVLLVVAILVALFLLVWSPPLLRQSRICTLCVEWHVPTLSRVTANRLNGTYAFTRGITFMIDFEEGDASVGTQLFSPGCHVGDAREGDTVRFESAREVHLEAPAPVDACS